VGVALDTALSLLDGAPADGVFISELGSLFAGVAEVVVDVGGEDEAMMLAAVGPPPWFGVEDSAGRVAVGSRGDGVVVDTSITLLFLSLPTGGVVVKVLVFVTSSVPEVLAISRMSW
jgi:hypothetical protein